jgi:hypothetical protein
MEWWQAASCNSPNTQSGARWAQTARRMLQQRFPTLNDKHWGEADAVCEDNRYSKKLGRVSTVTLLFHLLLWTCRVENDVDRVRPLLLLNGLMGFAFRKCKLQLHGWVSKPPLPSSLPKYSCEISNGIVLMQSTVRGVGQVGEKLDLTTILESLFITKRCDKLLVELMDELSEAIGHVLPAGNWQATCEKVLPAIGARRQGRAHVPLDCDVVRQLRQLQSGTLIRTARSLNRTARALGLGLHAGDEQADINDSRITALACRGVFSFSTTFSYCCDAKRFGGHHWLAGIIGDTQAELFSFANPVVRYM